MKLKKIASLMLASAMAVSMLAACGDQSPVDDNQDNDNGTVTTAPIVANVNEDQDKIDFVSDGSLTAALTKLVEEEGKGHNISEAEIKDFVERTTGLEYVTSTNSFNGNDWSRDWSSFWKYVCEDAGSDGDSMTKVFVERVSFKDAYNEDAAVEVAARSIVDTVDDLPTTTFVAMDNKDGKLPTVNGDDYSNYTYTGTMSDVVAVTGLNNQTYYYVAYTITQNTAVVTFTA